MILNHIELTEIPPFTKNFGKLNMIKDPLGNWWQIPYMIAKGDTGKCIGITAALHGNELNGVSVIHSLWKSIDVNKLTGTIILIPVLNVPGFLNGTREFSDGKDLNRLMPGAPNGTSSEVYANAIVKKLLLHFDYFIDLHTASFGHINSFYVKANLNHSEIYKMALAQSPQIIVNQPGPKGSLRSEAEKQRISALTIEAGNPNLFQDKFLKLSLLGLKNTLKILNMISDDGEINNEDKPVICQESYWNYANHAGILSVLPGLTDKVREGEIIATIIDIYGELIDTIKAPFDAVVIGKSTNPVCQVGSRVIHLGIVNDANE